MLTEPHGHDSVLSWILRGLLGARVLAGMRNGGLDRRIPDDGPFRSEEHRDTLVVRWRGSPVLRCGALIADRRRLSSG